MTTTLAAPTLSATDRCDRCNAQAYVRALEQMSGARISAIGVGPGRDEIIQLRPLI